MPDTPRMNRFFFHTHGRTLHVDEEGTNCPSRKEARREALKTAGTSSAECKADAYEGDTWQMTVTDENERVTRMITIEVEDR